MPLIGCSGKNVVPIPAPIIVENEIPMGLLSCMSEPDRPILNDSPRDRKNYENILLYIQDLKIAGADCRLKVDEIQKLVS